jgi:hypothetical protein
MQYATPDSMTLYISEYPNSVRNSGSNTNPIANDTFNKNRAFLLMIDRIQSNGHIGNDTTTGIWRLDFYANEKFLDIKRNHSYIFTINKLKSAPYITPTPSAYNTLSKLFTAPSRVLAWPQPGSNIEYTIDVEDDWVNAVYSNGQYAILTSADTLNNANIHLPFKVKIQMPPYIEQANIYQHELQFDPDANLVASDADIHIKKDGVLIVQRTNVLPLDGTVTTFEFTVETPLNTYVDIYVGNIYKKIPIILVP